MTVRPRNTSTLPTRRATLMATAALLLPIGHAMAQPASDTYPSRPIRIVVPYTPGSIGDLFIRPVAQTLSEKLGQAVIIDNRPGASQAIGAEFVSRAPADGYTLFMGTQSGFVLNYAARKKLPFDPVTDFSPVTMLFKTPMYLFVSASVPAKSVSELIALAKTQPGKLTFASIGPGTSSHLAGELLKSTANIDMLHVPYKGGPEATNALVSNQVDMMFNGGNSFAQMKQGNIRVLASGGAARTIALPNVPTFIESGVPGFEIVPWFALFAPANTPRPIIDRLNREISAIIKTPVNQQRADRLGVESAPSTPEELASLLKADIPVMTKAMRKAGIEPE